MLRRINYFLLIICLWCLGTIQTRPLLQTITCSEGSRQRLSNTSFQLESELENTHYQMNCEVVPSSHTAVLKLSLETIDRTQKPMMYDSPFSSKKSQGGEIHLLVFDNNGDILYREDFQNASALTGAGKYLICPGLNRLTSPSFGVVTIGNLGHRIVGHLFDSNMTLGEDVSVVLDEEDKFSLLAFEINSDIKRQFQVTVKSDEEELPCQLTVSKGCYAVQEIKNAGHYATIGLTFSKYGRITLSPASNPAFSSGHWFIGVKPLKKTLTTEWSKRITVVAEYGYNDRDHPVVYAALFSAFGGLFIAVFAHFLLNPQLEQLARDELDHGQPSGRLTTNEEKKPNIESANTTEQIETENTPDLNEIELIDTADVQNKENPTTRKQTYNPQVTPAGSTGDADEKASSLFYSQVDSSHKCKWYPKPGFFFKVIIFRWFQRGEKTFSYATGIMAISLLVGTMQFLIASWSKMYDTGNRDICYYNEACYRPLDNYDIPYNLIISNLAYCLHGVILAFSVAIREAIAMETNTKCDFSIAYAFAWTLSFEGVFSSFYHLCPSRQTFQFDSAFMFVISGLVVVALFNSRVKCKNDHHGLDSENNCRKPVNSSKFFLFFICPLLLLNYLGSMRDTTGLPAFGDGVFWVFLVLWFLSLYGWVLYKLQVRNMGCQPVNRFKWVMVLGCVPILILIIGIKTHKDWSQFFLFSCIAGSGLAIFGDIFIKVLERYQDYKQHQNNKYQKPKIGKFLDKAYFNVKVFFRVVYCAALGVCWAFAIYYFIFLPVTQKTKTPEYSRTFNTDCVLFNYYDPHDLWHILSSFGLLMSSYLLLYIT